MPTLTINFKGVCTHLVATHQHGEAPRFHLWTGREKIQHRIFLANSDLIATHIDPYRFVPPHAARLRIDPAWMTDALQKMLIFRGKYYERALHDEAIAFDDIDRDKGHDSHEHTLSDFPKLWNMSKPEGVYLRPRVLSGQWTRHASAYIDFIGGVEFARVKQDAVATVHFLEQPNLVFRPYNGDAGKIVCPIKDGACIEISNVAADDSCLASDYLLHYLATTLDLCEEGPVWPPP